MDCRGGNASEPLSTWNGEGEAGRLPSVTLRLPISAGVMGNCLAGDGCPFSHDPSALIGNLSVTDGSRPASPSLVS
jgi:hypothetical protein